MSVASALRLIVLAALWGASFLFLRLSVASMEPAWLITFRVGVAAVFLSAVALFTRRKFDWKAHKAELLVLGVLNGAIPFVFYALAAKALTASLMSIMNATAPIWGMLLTMIFMRQKPSFKGLAGLLLGIAGVALLVGLDKVSTKPGAGMAILASLAATFCYGLASVYTRMKVRGIASFDMAHGSMWAATLVLLPFLLWIPAPHTMAISPVVAVAVLGLGVLCTGWAFLIYFRLIQDIGPASTLTVTFLIPVFGILWGVLFLGESVSSNTFVGAALVLLGTALATGFSPRALWAKKAQA
ncbi:DMT family transporter [Iodobacter arcticus]|uniref:DMT family transporter n=1 Tax=Iodobacter arcticus TaxID=590593 RepID=A0ABW2QUW4_9NEIS